MIWYERLRVLLSSSSVSMAFRNYMSRLFRFTPSPGGGKWGRVGGRVGGIGMIVESTPRVASAASIIGSCRVSSMIS